MNKDDWAIFIYSIMRCIGNTIRRTVILIRVVPLCATNTTTKYKSVCLYLKFIPRNCTGNHIALYINMDNGTIFKLSNQRCIGNTIYNVAILSRDVPICEINTTTKYKSV